MALRGKRMSAKVGLDGFVCMYVLMQWFGYFEGDAFTENGNRTPHKHYAFIILVKSRSHCQVDVKHSFLSTHY